MSKANKFIDKAEKHVKLLIETYTELHTKEASENHFGAREHIKLQSCLTTLSAYVRWNEEVPPEKRSHLAEEALRDIIEERRENIGALSESIKNAEKKYLEQNLKDFYILTSLSIEYFDGLSDIHFDNGVTFSFSSKPPQDFSQDCVFEHAGDFLKPRKLPQSYTWVRISVKARCEYSAFQKAARNLDLLRVLWILITENVSFHENNIGKFKQISPIVLGPIHTLREKNGGPESRGFCEPSYIEEKPLKKLQPFYEEGKGGRGNIPQEVIERRPSYEKIEKERMHLLQEIEKCKYRGKIEDILVHYIQALDLTSPYSAFLHLWAVLEMITGKKANENYNDVIRRALAFCRERDFDKVILERIRTSRNNFVHQSEKIIEIDILLYKLHWYVRLGILFLIRECQEFDSFEAYTNSLEPRTEDEKKKE